MSDKVAMPERALAIYRRLKLAADFGELCPSNAELADCAGYAAPNAAGNAVKMLEDMGCIKVRRFQRARVVEVLETGKSTAAVPGRAIKFLDGRRRAFA